MIRAKVHSIESMGTSDGYGIRYIVFLSGCMLECSYCSNIDCAKGKFERIMTPQEIIDDMNKNREFYIQNGGGLTLCGGEPLLWTNFATEVFKLAKAEGYTTCLDTCGFTMANSMEKIPTLLNYTDHVLMDFKAFDERRHRDLTRSSNKRIYKVMEMMSDAGVEMWVRHVVINSVNVGGEGDVDFMKICHHIAEHMPTVTRFDLLAYHSFGEYKWEELGLVCKHSSDDTPSQTIMLERKQMAEDIFKQYGRSIEVTI